MIQVFPCPFQLAPRDLVRGAQVHQDRSEGSKDPAVFSAYFTWAEHSSELLFLYGKMCAICVQFLGSPIYMSRVMKPQERQAPFREIEEGRGCPDLVTQTVLDGFRTLEVAQGGIDRVT